MRLRRSGKNTEKKHTIKVLMTQIIILVGHSPHLELVFLECEVKWAIGRITMNKASGGDGIPAEPFQILKDDAVKVLHSYASKFGKLSSGHRTGKGQFSF